MEKKIAYTTDQERISAISDNPGFRLKEDAILLTEAYLIFTDEPFQSLPQTTQQEIGEIKTKLTLLTKLKNSFNSLLIFLRLKSLDSGIDEVN